MYQLCKHAIALGIMNGVITVPDTANPTAISRVRANPGRRPKVPPALQLLHASRASKRTRTAGSVVKASMASALTLQPAGNANNIAQRAALATPTAGDPRVALRTLPCTAVHSDPGGMQRNTSNAVTMQCGTLDAEAPLQARRMLPSLVDLCAQGDVQVDLNAAGSMQQSTESARDVLHGRMLSNAPTASLASTPSDANHMVVAAGVLRVSREDAIPDLNL